MQFKIYLMKIFLILSGLFITHIAIGQNIYDSLRNIKSVDEAKQYLIRYPNNTNELFEISSDKDTSAITKPLFSKEIGFIFTIDKLVYKILAIDSQKVFRVSYIYIDGNNFSQIIVDSIRNVIITKYKSGVPFVNLVTEFTMGGNPTGDTFWFKEQMMMPEFEKMVKSHKKGDIFTVDIPSKKWFYVALKTFEDKFIYKVVLLKTN